MKKLSTEMVLRLHDLVAIESGGSVGVRDNGLLDSALEGAFQTFGGKELYPEKEEKGAWLGYSLVSNHPFVDGNKRIGLLVMLTFLELNMVLLDFTDDELISLGLGLASGKVSYESLLDWVHAHIKQ